MNIGVVSPHTRKTGCSTLALMIGAQLSAKGRKTLVMNLNPERKSFERYLGYNKETPSGEKPDKTANPVRLAKMIRDNAIRPEEVHDYTKAYTKYCEVIQISGDIITQDITSIIDFVTGGEAYEFVVFDIDVSESESKEAKKAFDKCDVMLLVVNTDINGAERFKNRTKKIQRVIGGKPVITVVNKYCANACKVNELAVNMGVSKPNRWMTVRRNPYVEWATNHGEMPWFMEAMAKGDIRVADIYSDLTQIAKQITKVKIAHRKRKTEEQKELFRKLEEEEAAMELAEAEGTEYVAKEKTEASKNTEVVVEELDEDQWDKEINESETQGNTDEEDEGTGDKEVSREADDSDSE